MKTTTNSLGEKTHMLQKGSGAVVYFTVRNDSPDKVDVCKVVYETRWPDVHTTETLPIAEGRKLWTQFKKDGWV